MILGIGVDTANLERFAARVSGTPGLLERLFVAAERDRPAASLAARFAAKEATIKALGGAPSGFTWHDIVVVTGERGEPSLRLAGATQLLAASRGVARAHLSLTHDAPVATAFVVLEGEGPTEEKEEQRVP